MAPSRRVAWLLYRLLQFGRRRVYKCGLVRENPAYFDDPLLGLFPFLLLDGFANRGHGFDPIAGVNAGRIDFMLVPGASWQALRVGQLPLALHEQRIEWA